VGGREVTVYIYIFYLVYEIVYFSIGGFVLI
jgi:hypothetical protein